MTEGKRAVAREIACRHLARNDPLGWFEELYRRAAGDPSLIPWADLVPNPGMVAWLDLHAAPGSGKRALKVGCGLGDDAEALADRGFLTAAFDISATAVEWCRIRFPRSRVRYLVTDLFQAPAHWAMAFDLVVESYTLQVLTPEIRPHAMERIAGFVAPGGTLLVMARSRQATDPPGQMPWPLLREELEVFQRQGLEEVEFEDFLDRETPPVRRFRVTYERGKTR